MELFHDAFYTRGFKIIKNCLQKFNKFFVWILVTKV